MYSFFFRIYESVHGTSVLIAYVINAYAGVSNKASDEPLSTPMI